MSTTDNDKLLQRLASMEAELATLRAAPKRTAEDPNAWVQAMRLDPIGTMQRAGLPVDHVTRVMVAHAMGDQAPPELRVLAAMGPQVSATAKLQAQVDELSRQLSTQGQAGSRESAKALARDAQKYPNMAKALAADPTLIDEDLAAHGGDASEFLAKEEARLARAAKIFAPPPAASDQNADATKTAQSTQSTSATPGGDPPPLPKAPTPGVLTADEDARLKEEIVRKYSTPAPQ